ncbi:protein polyglycylase TTLL10 isoform X2 [Brachyhypopomus gauderio]|uniref:protein polyglycylase TTLL10 isoform X2 n=1 Tax=Brachyhypopomus gauderio TaxID=698409 RepID=UPI004040FF0C
MMSAGSQAGPARGREVSGAGQARGEGRVGRDVWTATEEQVSCPAALGRETRAEPVGEDQEERRKEVEKEKAPWKRQDALGMSREQVIRTDGAAPGSICLPEHCLSVSSRAPLRHHKGLGQVQQSQRERDKGPEGPRGPGPFFFFGGANGASLVVPYCESQGWQRVYDKTREDYTLKWCELKSSRTYYNFREGKQLVFQIPNNKVLTTKIGLLNSLREYDRVSRKVNHGRGQRRMKIEDFLPDTFRMDVKDERDAFFAQQEVLCPGKDNMWICKPTGLNQGRGIFLLQTPEDIAAFRTRIQNAVDGLTNRKTPSLTSQAQIVQRYIQKPLLLKGKKFDVRSYFLIACTSPYVVFFRHGYVRLTCDLYDPNSNNLSAHLTNQYMQKKNPLYSVLKEETVWSMERFNLYVNEKFMVPKRLPRDWVLSIFAVWLLEMNCNPALHTNCEVLKEVVPRTVTEVLDLVLEIFNKCRYGLTLLPLSSQRDFVLLYCAESKMESITHQRSRRGWPRGTASLKKAHEPSTMTPQEHNLTYRSTVAAKSTAPSQTPHHRGVPSMFSSHSSVRASPPASKPAEPRQHLTDETTERLSSISASTPDTPANPTAPFAAGPSSTSGPALRDVSVASLSGYDLGAEVAVRSKPSTKAREACRSHKGRPRRVELCLSKCTWQQLGLTPDLRMGSEMARSRGGGGRVPASPTRSQTDKQNQKRHAVRSHDVSKLKLL